MRSSFSGGALAGLPDRAPFVTALDREYVEDHERLHAGSELALVPPVSGGAATDEAVRKVALTPDPIDVDAAAAARRRPALRRTVVFTGTTREVPSLEYEAYEEMAIETMRRLADEAVRTHGLVAVASSTAPAASRWASRASSSRHRLRTARRPSRGPVPARPGQGQRADLEARAPRGGRATVGRGQPAQAVTVRELAAGETGLAVDALRALRPQHDDGDALVARIDDSSVPRATDRRVVRARDRAGARRRGLPHRTQPRLGRFLYVDDLSTSPRPAAEGTPAGASPGRRGGAREGCDSVELDSGVGPDRQDAHRRYFDSGMRIASYHFTWAPRLWTRPAA